MRRGGNGADFQAAFHSPSVQGLNGALKCSFFSRRVAIQRLLALSGRAAACD